MAESRKWKAQAIPQQRTTVLFSSPGRFPSVFSLHLFQVFWGRAGSTLQVSCGDQEVGRGHLRRSWGPRACTLLNQKPCSAESLLGVSNSHSPSRWPCTATYLSHPLLHGWRGEPDPELTSKRPQI